MEELLVRLPEVCVQLPNLILQSKWQKIFFLKKYLFIYLGSSRCLATLGIQDVLRAILVELDD